jgi:Mor family transcriptional regulator
MPTTDDLENCLSRVEGTLHDMAETAADELIRRHVDQHQARSLAAGIVTRWAKDYGGAMFYLPRGDSLERLARNLEICRLHDGTVKGPQGINALAQRYGLTEIHIWRVLAKGAKH